jgi:hypothetical protein
LGIKSGKTDTTYIQGGKSSMGTRAPEFRRMPKPSASERQQAFRLGFEEPAPSFNSVR